MASVLSIQQCVETLLQGDLLNAACLKFLLSKTLSVLIIFGSLILKVPQIINLLPKKGSGESGLAMSMFVGESIGYLTTIVYYYRNNHPFIAFGENVSILIQNLIIIALLHVSKPKGLGTEFIATFISFAALAAGLLSPAVVSMELLSQLQASSLFLFTASRAPQIWKNYRNKSTGQLSLVSVFLAWAGGCARIFTTLQENLPTLVLIGFIAGVVLNTIMLLQIFLYWKPQPKQATNAATKKKQA